MTMADMLPYKASGCGCAATPSYGNCGCGGGYAAPVRFVPAKPRHYAAATEKSEEEKGGFSWLALALAAGAVGTLYWMHASTPVSTGVVSGDYMDKYRRPL
jgi:hypothetical protein